MRLFIGFISGDDRKVKEQQLGAKVSQNRAVNPDHRSAGAPISAVFSGAAHPTAPVVITQFPTRGQRFTRGVFFVPE